VLSATLSRDSCWIISALSLLRLVRTESSYGQLSSDKSV
jgi:hypothetical protein